MADIDFTADPTADPSINFTPDQSPASQHPMYDAQGKFWAGVGDAGLTAVTGTLGAGAAGVADIYSRLAGKSEADRRGADEAVQDALTHQPTTPVGKAIIGGAGKLVGALSGKDWANGVGDAELMDSIQNDPAFKGLSPQQARQKLNSDPQYTVGSIADAAARKNIGDVPTDIAENTAGVAADVGNIAGAAMLRPTVRGGASAASDAVLAARSAKVGELPAVAEKAAAEASVPKAAPPKEAPGPVTADDLRADPQRLPDPPQEAPAAGAPEAPAAAAPAPEAAPEAPAPLEAPKSDEAEATAPAPDQAAQDKRGAAIQQLQADTGADMPNVRKSAITGNHEETGTDYQLANLGEPNMRAQLDQENHALTTASQQMVDRSGGTARGTGQAALEQRGTTIDNALQGVGGWFDKNIRQLYQTADAAAGQKPMAQFNNFHQLLDDHSQFTGAEGRQLHGDVQQVAKQFGMMNNEGFWQPTSVATVEKFRQWLGEQYSPRTGRVIGRMKDALDSDVAAHGGGGLYDDARALRYKRDQMLSGPKGIARLMPDKLPDGRLINRPVPLDKVPDHIANLPKEQFDHIINTLHDSSKLGNGELAEGNAAAINEIRQHMAERLHEAGTGHDSVSEPSKGDNTWNPANYHKQLNSYSTKLPGVFAPEGVRRFNTIHDAGNALRVNKRYGGAAKQLMQAGGMGEETRKRIASTVEGIGLGWMGPLKGGLADATGLSSKIREGIQRILPGGNAEKRNAAMAGERVKPLGAQIGGGNQRGAVGHLNAPGVVHDYEPSTGHHEVQSPNGVTHANDYLNGRDIVIDNTKTLPEGRGTGEGTLRVKKLADAAIARGGELRSDSIVSSDQQKVYAALRNAGYKVERNPSAVASGPALQAPNHEAVFRVSKPTLRTPQAGGIPGEKLGANPAFRKQAGAVSFGGDIYDRTPKKDVWSNERKVNERMPQKEQRTGNPYDSGGGRSMGDLAFGGKQRGGPKMSDFEKQRNSEKGGWLNKVIRDHNATVPTEPGYQASKELTNFVRKQAPEHVVDPKGPASWEELQQHKGAKVLPVNPQEAEGSIYGNTKDNIAFRAWHDKTHLDLGAGFDHEGELKVALEHQRQAKEAGLSEKDQRALWADTWETFKHHEDHGEFPAKPREFVAAQMQKHFPGDEKATVNIGLHQGDPANGGRVMQPQEAVTALKQAGVKINRKSISTAGSEPTMVASLDRPLTREEMQGVLAKTKQSSIPQRFENGGGEMHVAPGHEAIAKQQGWDKYDPEQFRMHDDRTALEHDSERNAYAEIKPHLTDKEQADIENRADSHRQSAIKNLLDTFHGSTSVEGTSAMALAGQAKKGWYAKAGKAINSVFGPDAPRFTALLAAMSPQTSVEMNFHNALHTFVNWDKAGRPTDAGAIKKIMEDSSLKDPDSESKSNVMDAWHQNGVRALTSKDPEHEDFQLSGPKVDSFHKNLRGATHEVTNDSWNAIAMNIDQKLFSGAYRKVAGDIFGRLGFKSPTYMGVSAKVRAAALQLSHLTGEAWTPREVQETMWSFVKTAFETAKATGKSIPELMKSGELNDELIRGTSDFHSLFGAPEHRGFLDESRFGEAARRVAAGQGEGTHPARTSKTRAAAEENLRPHLVSEGERLETARQARLANRKARIGNIQVPF